MIRVLLAINFGLAVAAAFAIYEALAESLKRRRQDELAGMIVDLSGYFEGVDLSISPEEMTKMEESLGFVPTWITLTGRYDDNSPFVTINKDAVN